MMINETKRQLLSGRFFSNGVSVENLPILLEQYWHVLTYFPVFLARIISNPDANLEVRTHVSSILDQELGNGDVGRAHETLYIDMLRELGVASPQGRSFMTPETQQLIEVYRRSHESHGQELGVMQATEETDLAIVSAITRAIRSHDGEELRFSWTDIHLKQEPGHVKSSSSAIDGYRAQSNRGDDLRIGADRTWIAWSHFFEQFC